jgi:hypothetical protein
MRSIFLLPALFAGALAAGPAATAAPRAAPSEERAIPFVHSDGIIEWKVGGRDTLYVRAMNGSWYLVRTSAPCPRLRTAMALGFETSPGDQLDRYGAILADGWRCQIASVTLSPPPPPDVAKHG